MTKRFEGTRNERFLKMIYLQWYVGNVFSRPQWESPPKRESRLELNYFELFGVVPLPAS